MKGPKKLDSGDQTKIAWLHELQLRGPINVENGQEESDTAFETVDFHSRQFLITTEIYVDTKSKLCSIDWVKLQLKRKQGLQCISKYGANSNHS